MEDLYACVRFIDDLKTNQFVSVNEIKYHINDNDHIRPDTVDDFDSQHEYDVLWCLCNTKDCTDVDKEKCIYYKAYIVCLAETLADVEEKSNTTRFRLPRKIFSPSDPNPTVSSQSIFQKKDSSVSGLNNFSEKLVVKLENLNHTRAMQAAKLKASKEQLSTYAQNKFMAGRKSFQSSCQNDNENVRKRSNENGCGYSGSLPSKKGRTSNQTESEHSDDSRDDADNLPENNEQTDLELEDPLRSVSPINNILEAPDWTGNHDQNPENENNERDPLMRLQAGARRVQSIRKPDRVVRPREIVPVEMSADERAINLYITPEAVEVDARDRQKYQVFDNNLIYLGEGKAVDKDSWDFLKLRGDSTFLRETAELICGKHDLVNRCIKEKKTSVSIADRSPRKAIPPRKYFLIRDLFQDYMKEREYDKKTRDRLLSTFN